MITWRRACEPLLVAALLAPPVALLAAEPAALVEGLEGVGGVAVRAAIAPNKGVEVFLGLPQPGAVSRIEYAQGEPTDLESRIESLPPGPKSLAWLNPTTLLVGGDGIASYRVPRGRAAASERSAARARAGALGRVSQIATDSRHLFAVAQQQLWRGRHAGGRLTALRRFDLATPVLSAAISPRGYLATLHPPTAESEPHTLAFRDPQRPDETVSVVAIDGLTDPVALVFGVAPQPSERLLFAIDRGGEGRPGGLQRVDAAPVEGPRPRAVAKLLLGIERPIALAAGADGAVYITHTDAEGRGALTRYDLTQP